MENQINKLNNKITSLETKIINSEDKVVGIDLENEKILLLKSPYNSNIKTENIISEKIINSHIYPGNDVSDIINPLIEKYDDIKHLYYEYTLNNDDYNGLLDIDTYEIEEIDSDEIPIADFKTHEEYYNYAIQFESFRERYTDYEDYITKRFKNIYSKYNRPDYSIELLEYNRQEIDDILDKNGKYLVIETIDDYSVKGKTTIGYLADEKEDEENISDYLENFIGAWYRGKLAELNTISFDEKNNLKIEDTNYINKSLLRLDYNSSETLNKIKDIYPEYNNFQTKEEALKCINKQEKKNIEIKNKSFKEKLEKKLEEKTKEKEKHKEINKEQKIER